MSVSGVVFLCISGVVIVSLIDVSVSVVGYQY